MLGSNDNKRIYITMIISISVLILRIAISLVITPLITNKLGVEAYGYVTLSRNFTSYAEILLVALNAFSTRYITVSYLKNEKEEFQKFYSSTYWGNVVLSGSVLLIGLVLTLTLDKFLHISENYLFDVKLLFLLTFMTFFISHVGTIYHVTGVMVNRLDKIQVVKFLQAIVDALLLIVFFIILKPQTWYMGLVSLLVAVLGFCGCKLIKNIYIPDIKPKINYVDKKSLTILFKNGMWSAINSIGNELNSGLDLLITNLLLSEVGMGQIAISKTFLTLTSQLNSSMSGAFNPQFLKLYSEGNKKELITKFKDAMKLCAIPINVIFAGFVAVGLPFLNLWVPTQDTKLLYILTIIALIPAIAEGPIYPLYNIYTLTVKNKIPCIVTIIGGLANVVSMYFLLKYTSLGVYAVLITTAVIMSIINYIINPIYMSHCLNVRLTVFYPTILLNVLSVIITSIVLYLLAGVLPLADNWILLLVEIASLGIIGLLIQAIMLLRLRNIKELLKISKHSDV